jgi:hypothetical protein
MPTDVIVDPEKIFDALKRVNNQATFIQELLAVTLNWPILDHGIVEVDAITYGWSGSGRKTPNAEKELAEGRVLEVNLTGPGQQWGIFILEFKDPALFDAGRGMTGVLREVLRELVPSRRDKTGDKRTWNRDHLLFICTRDYSQFRFACFKDALEERGQAGLAAFGWHAGSTAVRTVCQFNLCHLGWPSGPESKNHWVEQWSSAFDVERVTKRFYEDYARELERLGESVKGLAGEEQKMFTQTLLNRLMFLRFIERKGWLRPPGGGEPREYLRELFSKGGYDGKSFYAGRLRKLFFEGLAVEGKQEHASIGKVHFLNGRLFEESELDKSVPDVGDDAIAPLLGSEGLLYRYSFTVQESTPHNVEVAVDPEMLGKVFEELITGRHESGSYYTPKPVVSFMCRQALKGYLADTTQVETAKIKALVDVHDTTGLSASESQSLAARLQEIKAVDPACGSGAYLLGLLHELVGLYRLLSASDPETAAHNAYELKLWIIEHNLYGVDKSPFAVEMAMLRLWLSLAVDVRLEGDRPPPSLPNLDFKVVTGDSLMGPCDPVVGDSLRVKVVYSLAERAVGFKEEYITARGARKEALRRQINQHRQTIRRELQHEHEADEIDWNAQFTEVFFSNDPRLRQRRRGFDVVLANPPYVRQELIGDAKPKLQARFGDAVEGKSDLYCYFYLRALQLLRPGGIQVFVCSNSWLDTGFGRRLQEFFLRNGHILAIYDSAVERQFSTADVNTLISVVQRTKPCADHITRFISFRAAFARSEADATLRREVRRSRAELWDPSAGSNGKAQHGYSGGKWGGKLLRAPDLFVALAGAQNTVALGSATAWRFGRGRRTGCDDFFYLTDEEAANWGIERRFLKKLVKSPAEFKDLAPRTSLLSPSPLVFLCHEPMNRLHGTGALRYIAHGESLGYGERNLARSGGRWYDLGQQPLADVILPIAFHDRFFIVVNDAGAEAHQRFATFRLVDDVAKREELIELLAGILSSAVVPLQAEVLGRRGLGQGALDFPPEDWRSVTIPDPWRLAADVRRDIVRAWREVAGIPPPTWQRRTERPAFRVLDEAVLRAYSLAPDCVELLHREVASMIGQRLEKARRQPVIHEKSLTWQKGE